MRGQGQRRGTRGHRTEHADPLGSEVERCDNDRQQHQGHQSTGDLGRVPFHQPDDQKGTNSDRHRVQIGTGNGIEQGHDSDKVALGLDGARHGLLDPFRRH